MTLLPADNFVDRSEILPLMGEVKISGEWTFAACPCHADGQHKGKAGWSLGLSKAGVLKCFAGCEFKDVIAALRGPGYQRPQSPTPIRREPDRLVKTYLYTDADGTVIAEKGRFETADGRKSFRWRLPGAERWDGLAGMNMNNVPLYGVASLTKRADEPVYFVEGEKACEACWDEGLLAVTLGGGAGQKDFGAALEPLKARTVYLWPDNDAPGRSYMALIEAKLSGVAAETRYITSPLALPLKSDAYDYFAAGGSVEALEARSPHEPTVTVLAEDAVRVTLPTLSGVVTMDFAEMEKGSRELDASITVTCFQSAQRPYQQRLNLDSSSGRTEMRRDLDSLYGKDYNWTAVMNTALALARATFLMQDRGCDVFDIPEPMGDVLLIPPMVAAEGTTIWFGDGSSGKSYLSDYFALCCALGISPLGFQAPVTKVMVVDYEDGAGNFKRRLKRLAAGIETDLEPIGVIYWPAKGVPFRDQVEAIKAKCTKEGVGWVIIDSAAPACGGDPEKSEHVLSFFRALAKLGLPTLILAHITKAGETNTQKPFGSAFWHNEARRTWYISRVQEDDADEIDIGLYCRKVNDGTRPSPLAVRMSFTGKTGPVRVGLQAMEKVPELLSQTSNRNQVWTALTEPMTVAAIARLTGLLEKTVDSVLGRGPFERAGTMEPAGKGRPAVLWRRQE